MNIVDDIGSFPLPEWISKNEFDDHYQKAREEIFLGNRGENYKILKGVLLESFEKKIDSGIDIVTYPQHYDMHKQFLEIIDKHQKDPFVIPEIKALLPEIMIAEESSKELYEKRDSPIKLRVCVTGPVDLYLRSGFGNNLYKDILENLARSVNSFLKNSILKKNYISTVSLAIDEPSIGLADLLNIEEDDIIDILEIALKGIKLPVQIHLHSLKSAGIALETTGISTITGEFAATPQNMELIKKKDLESYDKYLRAGVTRTNIDSIIAEFLDQGVEPPPHLLIDSLGDIRARIKFISKRFGDRVSSWGPDCGLGSWPTQETAQLLLKRTAEAVKGKL